MKRTFVTLALFLSSLGGLGFGTFGQGWTVRTLAQTSAPTGALSQLQAGTYFAQGSMYARSYRVVARRGDRLCIKIVNGPPNPYQGESMVTVSTVTAQRGRILVTATHEPLIVRGSRTFVNDDEISGEWQLATHSIDAKIQQNLSAGLQSCLDGQGNYAKQSKGPFIAGQIYPSAPGRLVAQQAQAQINVRQEPKMQAKILHYGLAGDRVQMLQSRYDENKVLWYEVRFEVSGATGWVRYDFVRRSAR